MPVEIPKLRQETVLYVLNNLKICLEDINRGIKAAGACADESSKLSAKARAYFEEQTDIDKECAAEVKQLIEAIRNA